MCHIKSYGSQSVAMLDRGRSFKLYSDERNVISETTLFQNIIFDFKALMIRKWIKAKYLV